MQFCNKNQTVMANENFILVDNVDVYNKAFGLDTLHPLVSVVDLSKTTKTLRRARMHYGVYALFLNPMSYLF